MYTSKAQDVLLIVERLSDGTRRGLKIGAGAVGAAGAGLLAHHVYQHGLDNTIEQIKHLAGYGTKKSYSGIPDGTETYGRGLPSKPYPDEGRPLPWGPKNRGASGSWGR